MSVGATGKRGNREMTRAAVAAGVEEKLRVPPACHKAHTLS